MFFDSNFLILNMGMWGGGSTVFSMKLIVLARGQVRIATSRSLGVAHMSANLRRSLHDDLEQESLRLNIGRYLLSFSDLVEEDWSTFRELQTFTTGHNLDIMFADRTEEHDAILLAVPDERVTDTSSRDRLAHFMTLTRKSGYYAVPSKHQVNPNTTSYICFQVLGFRPGHRKYMQRLTQWSIDEWKGALSCAVLGTFDIPKGTSLEDCEEIQAMTSDARFKTLSSVVQPLPLDDLFVNNSIDYLHEFQSIVHVTEFDEASVQDMMMDPENESIPDQTLVTLVSD